MDPTAYHLPNFRNHTNFVQFFFKMRSNFRYCMYKNLDNNTNRQKKRPRASTLAAHKKFYYVSFNRLPLKCSDRLKSVDSQRATSEKSPNVIIACIGRIRVGLATAHDNLIFFSRIFPPQGN